MSRGAPIGFEELLRPMTPQAFLGGVMGREPHHFPGDAARFAHLFSFPELNALLGMWRLWSDRTFKVVLDGRDVEPEEFCVSGQGRDGRQALLLSAPRIEALLARGATVVLDVMESLCPQVRELAQALQSALAARVACNAYCSFQAHAGFPSHYDTTDVFAVQVAGTKRWRVYRGRAELPLDLPGYSYSYQPREHHERARGPLLMELEMTPGDVLYLPRGQYHDALASSGASLHLSFGITRPTALDFMSLLSQALPDDPLFRAELPHFDDPRAIAGCLERVAARLSDLVRAPDLAAQVASWQRERVFRNMPPAMELPARAEDTWVRLRRGAGVHRIGGTLVVAGAPLELAPGDAPIVDWMLAREVFRASELCATLGLDPERARSLLDRLAAAGLVEPV